MPAAAILASAASRFALRGIALSGVILVGGGLAGLAILPDSEVVWTFAPQVLIGCGLALTLGPLTIAALGGLAPDGLHGGWTVAFRHGGVVLGLLILTPLFTADLDSQEVAAERAGAAAIIDSSLSIHGQARPRAGGRRRAGAERERACPTSARSSSAQHPSAEDRPEYARLEAALTDQARRAATHAFSRSFFVAAGLAFAAARPAPARPRPEGGRMSALRLPAVAVVAVAVVLGVRARGRRARLRPGGRARPVRAVTRGATRTA